MSFSQTVQEHQSVINDLGGCYDTVEKLADILTTCLKNKHKVLWAGNGGSAADAQHMAAELMVRYRINRPALNSVALTTDTSVLTAGGNDLGYDKIFSRQVEGLGAAGDCLILLSTSGNSPNCVLAAQSAQALNITTIALTGSKDSKLLDLCDYTIQVPSSITARIQEAHTLICHYWCDHIEQAFA